MGLKKGRTNNPNGRPVGKQNRVTTEIKDVINKFLKENTNNLQTEFDNLESKDKLRFVIDLLPYAVPKLQSVEVKETEPEEQIKPTIIFRDFENDPLKEII